MYVFELYLKYKRDIIELFSSKPLSMPTIDVSLFLYKSPLLCLTESISVIHLELLVIFSHSRWTFSLICMTLYDLFGVLCADYNRLFIVLNSESSLYSTNFSFLNNLTLYPNK